MCPENLQLPLLLPSSNFHPITPSTCWISVPPTSAWAQKCAPMAASRIPESVKHNGKVVFSMKKCPCGFWGDTFIPFTLRMLKVQKNKYTPGKNYTSHLWKARKSSTQKCLWLPFFLVPGDVNSGRNGGTTGMVPLIISSIYTLENGYLLGISPLNISKWEKYMPTPTA